MKNQTLKTVFVVACLAFSTQGFAFGKLLPNESTPKPTPTPVPTPKPTPAPTPSPTPTATSVKPLWESKHADGREWTDHVLKTLDTLGQSMIDTVPADAAAFCPNYAKLTDSRRKEFWAYLLSAMVRFESNFKPATTYQEAFKDQNGNYVISRGLLQLSIESANSYGCNIRQATELHDPEINLSCGIRIMNRWLGRDGRIAGKVGGAWKGGARYWAVLRGPGKTSYDTIVSLTKALPICK